jgi:DNA-binding GntR family transcriptional regulator
MIALPGITPSVPYDPDALAQLVARLRTSHSTAQDLVLAALREAIHESILPPGTRLRQEELSAVFETSRIPVHEALRVLEYEGFVESEPRRGFVVIGLDADQLEEIYELRSVLETHALRLAIPLLTDVDLAELAELYDEMEHAEDPDRRLLRRDQFYLRLYAVAARQQLLDLIVRLRKRIPRPLRWQLVRHLHEPGHRRAVFEAVQNGDADRAAAELESHYRKVIGLLRRFLREAKQRPADTGPPSGVVLPEIPTRAAPTKPLRPRRAK